MSNKSLQEPTNQSFDHELEQAIMEAIVGDYPVSYSEEGKRRAANLRSAIHSHMQTAFEYVIGDTDKIGADGLRASDGADMRYKVHEQRLRAAKWLGGDK